ncbi:TetR/AcrR family transcriptional regulator [Pseudomonas sp. R2.Fl]|nr:TetR/AcrR family transcriptional regulator [Pseudomonas sp. R2.Fl]
MTIAPPRNARDRLLDAALLLIRQKGYAATSVDDLCRAAGVTKGAFFHHFASKEDLAVAAAGHFSAMADDIFETAPYRMLSDPLDRLLGYVAFRRSILDGALADYTCLLGTMVQEAYATSPAIRAACDAALSHHVDTLAPDVAEAIRRHRPDAPFTAESLAYHMQTVIQGAFIFAKAKGGPEIAAESLDHLSRYIALLFGATRKKEE